MRAITTRHHELDRAIGWIRRSDPLRDEPVAGWSRTDRAEEMLRLIVATGGSTAPSSASSLRRRVPGPLLLAAALLVVGGSAAGAGLLLGGPAPAPVKQDLSGVDQGMPTDLRFDPDVRNARLVADADGAQLYAADLADGGYCAEIVTPDARPAGAVCTPENELTQLPIGVTVPFVDPVTIRSPLVVGGRVNVPGATSLGAVFSDGAEQPVTLGDGGFFVFAVTTAHLADAHRNGFSLVATGPDGAQIATTDVPATDFTDPAAQDAKQPIFVSTISTQSDFTKVLGIEGSVNIAGAAALELRYPDGTVVDVPLDANGRYHYDLPPARRDDLSERPGELVARNVHGDELAAQPVAAVAFWRSQ